jgi:hypothetical protein
MKTVLTLTICAALLVSAAAADEGMWLLNNPPTRQLKEKYGFEASATWLEHLQRSAVRFNNGGSGAFVSADGLVLTNQHVGADCVQKMGTREKDYIHLGFQAASRAGEPRCADLELNVLDSMEDVTARVSSAVTPEMSAAASQKARRAAINSIEKESLDRTGLRSDVVTLYNGGQYHLYRYKKYTDVRLVFTPELDITFFGGDPDNFEFPRYNLDITFFRAYENGAPVKVRHYLKWSPAGARDGELVFIAGHPGRTERLDTVAHLEFLRDFVEPRSLNGLRRLEVLLDAYSSRSIENTRRAQEDLRSVQNSRKARLGSLAGLQDPAVMERKRAEEKALREAVEKSPELRKAYGDAWNQIAAAVDNYRRIQPEYQLLEAGTAFRSELFAKARTLLRMAEESKKPNAERLREYSEAALESLKQELFSEAPIYPDLETVKLADSLALLMETLGAEHDVVKKVLAGKSPRARAAELINGTRLADVTVRKKLAEGGSGAIEASSDPMIAFARLVDAPARALRKTHEERVDEPMRQGYAKLARARFAVYKDSVYPDATFTLRLGFGEVKGYEEDGRAIPWTTTLGGTFSHAADHQYREPFNLPKSWMDNKDKLNAATPFNFVSTVDIIGGNSGSPVVNRAGEFVGIIFDMNLPSLVYRFAYTDVGARAVSVHSEGIIEALKTVYGAKALVEELGR